MGTRATQETIEDVQARQPRAVNLEFSLDAEPEVAKAVREGAEREVEEKPKPLNAGKRLEKNLTAGQWLKRMAHNPEKYGTTEKHIRAVDKKIKEAEDDMARQKAKQEKRDADGKKTKEGDGE